MYNLTIHVQIYCNVSAIDWIDCLSHLSRSNWLNPSHFERGISARGVVAKEKSGLKGFLVHRSSHSPQQLQRRMLWARGPARAEAPASSPRHRRPAAGQPCTHTRTFNSIRGILFMFGKSGWIHTHVGKQTPISRSNYRSAYRLAISSEGIFT